MSKINKNYHTLLDKILQEGYLYDDPNREGVKRLEIPSYTFRHEFKDGFPAITTKKLNYKSVITELIWFLRGDTNIKYLVDNGCNIWNKDAYNYYLKQNNNKLTNISFEHFVEAIKEYEKTQLNNWFGNNNYNLGDLGPVYGHQWRNYGENRAYWDGYHDKVDQIDNLIKGLKEKPLGTEHIVNSWNVGDLSEMALPPCHYGFQVVVRPLSDLELNMMKQQVIIDVYHKDKSKCVEPYLEEEYKKLPKYGFELHWIQRSVDSFLGLPFNIASYATLALILEKITGYKALGIQGDLKKVHLYDNSFDAVKEQLSRDVDKYGECELNISHLVDIDIKKYPNNLDMFINRLKPEDFTLDNYESYPYIKVEMLERDE